MSKAKGKNAVCEVCGTRGLIRNTNGVDVCATCEKITGNVKNHIGRIVEIARLMGKQDELVQALGLSDGAATTTSEGAAQLEAAVSAAMRTLSEALPADPRDDPDKGRTHSFLDIEDLAKRAAPLVKSGKAWDELMRLAEEAGIGGLVAAHPPEDLARRFVAKAVEPMEELNTLKAKAAELLGFPQDEIIQALSLTEATLRTIREAVEPELEGEKYDSLPEACRLLVARYHAVRDAEHDAAEDEARTAELETRLMEAEREQDRLRERLRERLKTGNDPTEDALLQWAIRKYQAGKITLQIEVQEMEAAA